MSVYQVVGRHPYREHPPGSRFEAALEPDVEERAVRHGAIRVLERTDPRLQPGSYTPPRGWDLPLFQQSKE